MGPSRRLIVLLLAITVVPLVSLLWLGHYVLQEDRRSVAEQESERIAAAAARVVATIDRSIAADEQRLAANAPDWPAGAVVVTFRPGRVEAVPPRRVAFYPESAPLREADDTLFEPVDRAEYQLQDGRTATDLLEVLAGSEDAAVRATARLRLARSLAAHGNPDRALQIYSPLTAVDDVAVGGVPVALVARFQQCQLFAQLGRTAAQKREAAALHADLVDGRWTLTAPVFALYLKDVDTWMNESHSHPTAQEQLAGAVHSLWKVRDRVAAGAQSRFPLDESDGRQYVVLAQPRDGQIRALVATDEYVRATWLPQASAVASELGVTMRLSGLEGRDASADTKPVVLSAAASHLPWDVTVARSPATERQEATSRRMLLISGLAVLIAMALGSSYLIARAVHREIAVARLKSDFVAAVSHEFRTPLTTLRQFTEMLRDGTIGEEQRQLGYDAQSRATDRLTQLVESVLDLGRMEAGKQRYRFETVSCGAVVRAIVDEFQQDVSAAGYRLEYQEVADADVSADTEALGRATRNLLENAVKYSPTERTVHISVARRSRDVAIAVRDRGIGIAASERKSIFDRFHRGAEATRRGIAGTGIGLAMVDHIVRAHRGRVEVDSEPGKGSTFTIVLPLSAAEPVAVRARVTG